MVGGAVSSVLCLQAAAQAWILRLPPKQETVEQLLISDTTHAQPKLVVPCHVLGLDDVCTAVGGDV